MNLLYGIKLQYQKGRIGVAHLFCVCVGRYQDSLIILGSYLECKCTLLPSSKTELYMKEDTDCVTNRAFTLVSNW